MVHKSRTLPMLFAILLLSGDEAAARFKKNGQGVVSALQPTVPALAYPWWVALR